MRKRWQWPLLLMAGIILFFSSPPLIGQARDITEVVGLDVNSAVIKDDSGNVIAHDAQLPDYQHYTVNYNWSIPNGVPLTAGDTLTFHVPENVRIPADDSFPMKGILGNTIGQTFIAAGSHTGTVTLNRALQYTPLNRKGYITLDVYGTVPDHNNDLAPILMDKTASWVDPNDPTTINWTIDVLANSNSLVNPVITDNLSANQTYVAGSAKLTDATGGEIPVTATPVGNQIEFMATGDFVTSLKLTYQTTTNSPSGAETFTNSAEYTDDTGNAGSAEATIDRPAPSEPEQPGTSEPENPGTSEPENPGTSEPENPGTSEPENPGTSEPENPGTTEPEKPGTSEPEKPGTSEPENPGTSEPEKPGTSEPENPGTLPLIHLSEPTRPY